MKSCRVECGHPTSQLILRYGSESNVALSKCAKCDEFCDKYQEFNSVVIFIDVLLLKSQAYRHLLFNKFQKPSQFHHMLMKISLIFLSIDVFVKWFKKDQMIGSEMLFFKFVYFFILSSLEFGIYAFAAHLSGKIFTANSYSQSKTELDSLIFFASFVISSYPKLFHVLMVIWDYEELKYSWIVKMYVFASNVVALNVCINGAYWEASLMFFVGFLVNSLVVLLAESIWSL